MPACATCVHRKRDCDAVKPRCFQCKRSHLRCVYDSEPSTFEFRDETEQIVGKSSSRSRRRLTKMTKRRKDSHASSKSPDSQDDIIRPHTNSINIEFIGGSVPNFENPATMPLDMPFDYHLDHDQLWDMSLQNSLDWDPGNGEYGVFLASLPQAFGTEELMTTSSHQEAQPQHIDSTNPVSSPATIVSDQILAQHYNRNLTSMYSSKNPGWNFHTYFFNRFNSKHPFVMASLYAWTSAHLFCQDHLESSTNALSNYDKCLLHLKQLFNIDLAGQSNVGIEEFMGADLIQDDLDAIAVSLYFLASTDLILSRPDKLGNILEFEAKILQSHQLDGPDSVFIKIATWFCFLDARASAFGRAPGNVIQAVGGESGILAALHDSEDFLEKEYKKLYPQEEMQRDKAHFPLYSVTCRLVVLFGRISRFYCDKDNTIRTDVRSSLDEIKLFLDTTSEDKAVEDNVLSIFFTTSTLYDAVEIYFSRTFELDIGRFSTDAYAARIIRTTDRYYEALKRPRTEPPPTKVWPLPLVMAAIEAKDPIYRGWAIQKIRDYSHAGKHYANSCAFVEKVLSREERTQKRVDLPTVAKDMGDGFVL